MVIVFLGDSITAGFMELAKHGVINLGIPGDRTIDVIERLPGVVSYQPDRLFLMIGINDILTNHGIGFTDKPIATEATYELIVRYLVNHLQTKDIYLLSVLPVRSIHIFQPDDEKKLNEAIDRLNDHIERLARQYGIHYLHIIDDFKDPYGRLKSTWTTDGIHLSKEGYSCLYEKLKYLLR